MKTISQTSFSVFMALILVLAIPAQTASAQLYIFTDLGTLPGTTHSVATGINNRGDIVGWVQTGSGSNMVVEPFLYTNGKMQTLGTLGGNYARANGINDSGDIVGDSTTRCTPPGSRHAFLYSNGVMKDLGTLGNNHCQHGSWGMGINNLGHVVGGAETDTEEHAYLYSGEMVDLGTLGEGDFSVALGINNYGEVVGYSTDVSFPTPAPIRAFLWKN